MKIKSDFITNSSSANFILEIEFPDLNSLDRFSKMYKDEITSLFSMYNVESKSIGKTMKMEYCTSMYNEYEDMPYLFREIYLSYIFGADKFFIDEVNEVKLTIEDLH